MRVARRGENRAGHGRPTGAVGGSRLLDCGAHEGRVGGEGLPFFAVACAVSYMLSGYYGLYSEQKIVYSKSKPEYINKKAE